MMQLLKETAEFIAWGILFMVVYLIGFIGMTGIMEAFSK